MILSATCIQKYEVIRVKIFSFPDGSVDTVRERHHK